MRRWPSPDKKKARIEIVPMIDVMMFLLVFFVLISVNVIPALGVKTRLPESAQAASIKSPARQVLVTLGEGGRIALDGRDTVLASLGGAIRQATGGAQQVAVVINSDRGAEVQLLLDVMDHLKGHGFESISVAARERR